MAPTTDLGAAPKALRPPDEQADAARHASAKLRSPYDLAVCEPGPEDGDRHGSEMKDESFSKLAFRAPCTRSAQISLEIRRARGLPKFLKELPETLA